MIVQQCLFFFSTDDADVFSSDETQVFLYAIKVLLVVKEQTVDVMKALLCFPTSLTSQGTNIRLR